MSLHRFTIDVAAEHPAFEGHFPGHPVLPGVALLAEVLAGVERWLGMNLDAVQIKVAKFHAPVVPGSVLTVDLANAGGIAFTVSCAETRVATGTLTMTESGTGRQPTRLASGGNREAQ